MNKIIYNKEEDYDLNKTIWYISKNIHTSNTSNIQTVLKTFGKHSNYYRLLKALQLYICNDSKYCLLIRQILTTTGTDDNIAKQLKINIKKSNNLLINGPNDIINKKYASIIINGISLFTKKEQEDLINNAGKYTKELNIIDYNMPDVYLLLAYFTIINAMSGHIQKLTWNKTNINDIKSITLSNGFTLIDEITDKSINANPLNSIVLKFKK